MYVADKKETIDINSDTPDPIKYMRTPSKHVVFALKCRKPMTTCAIARGRLHRTTMRRTTKTLSVMLMRRDNTVFMISRRRKNF